MENIKEKTISGLKYDSVSVTALKNKEWGIKTKNQWYIGSFY